MEESHVNALLSRHNKHEESQVIACQYFLRKKNFAWLRICEHMHGYRPENISSVILAAAQKPKSTECDVGMRVCVKQNNNTTVETHSCWEAESLLSSVMSNVITG
jgi:hypothetical protein